MAKKTGFTLIELMLGMSILSIVVGIFAVLLETVDMTTSVQNSEMITSDDVRLGMMGLRKELRLASAESIVWNESMQSTRLDYRIPVDLDGNGTPLDVNGVVELTEVRSLFRDVDDINGDGLAGSQLVWTDGDRVRVVANHLLEDEDANRNGDLDNGEDRNGNGVLDRGLHFEKVGKSVRVTIQATHRTSSRAPAVQSTLQELVTPRN